MNSDLVDQISVYCRENFGNSACAMALTGSHAIEVATRHSDVDIIIMLSQGSPTSTVGTFIYEKILNNRIEILVLSQETIRNIIDRAIDSDYRGLNHTERCPSSNDDCLSASCRLARSELRAG
ncbi:hypothetical protein CQ054_21525 [Ochrobactrum sp. MYb29]|nr:hypothetical protein CQ054_21525 [Ochrobactrum sp. MYb29]